MVIFLSSAQSVYFKQYFCLMCIYQLFLILDHTKSYVEETLWKSGVTNVALTGTRSPASTKQIVRGHRRNQTAWPPNF